MFNTKIGGMGFYVPERVVTNEELCQHMDSSDEWIRERTGIEERRYAKKHEETATTMAVEAAKKAIDKAGISKDDIDFIIFATLSPDYYFPGCGVLLQRALELPNIGALDIRNQCSGFVYGLSVADQFIKTGKYKNILLVGAEFHSAGLDYSTKGRNVTVIFGDGAGAAILQPTKEEGKGVLTTHLHSDGKGAEQLVFINPGAHGGKWLGTKGFGYPEAESLGGIFLTDQMMKEGQVFPNMNGQAVFKYAVTKFPEVIKEALDATGLETSDIDLFVPHQANLRISQFVQKKLRLPDEKVWNNIQRYGNTTAASIPIALTEAIEAGKVKDGDLVCIAAFGAGFTWASALIRF